MQQLHPTMDKFYLSILDYAGMKVENGIFVNKNEKIGEMTIDGRHLGMPYFDNMKNPNNRLLFHPLNENYPVPETAVFNLYKKRLVLELNLRLSSLLVSLIGVAGDVTLQQRIKSSKLIQMVSSIGEVELPLVEGFLDMVKASKKANTEAFLFDIFLKKNGEINDTPYAAIGKLNFLMFNEINRSLKEGDYKVFGAKVTKKNLIPLDNLFRVVFPTIDDPNSYSEGTDNKVFRYLNILLKTSYQISARMNEIADMLEELNEPALNLEEIRSNMDWVGCLEELYGMASEIRLIPNQTDLSVEAAKMKLDESKASAATPASTTTGSAPAFDPSRAAPTAAVAMPAAPQPQQQMMPTAPQQPLSPEDIIRGQVAGGMGMAPGMMMGGMMPMMAPGMMQPQVHVPQWVLQDQINNGQAPQQMMPMQMQPMQMVAQPMQVMQPAQPQIIQTPQGPMIMTPQGMVPAQLMAGGGMMTGTGMMAPAQQGLAVNPLFMNRTVAPFS